MALYKRRVRGLTVFVIIAVFVGLPCIIILSQNPALLRFQYEVSRGFQFLLGKEVEGHRREPPWRETLKQHAEEVQAQEPEGLDGELDSNNADEEELPGLEDILARASMPDKTVILTTLNAAWAQPNTMIDLFLDSFHQGEGIEYLLNHLVIIALDQVAYNRCTELHTACFMLTTEGVDFAAEKFFMTGEYLMMMWRRIEFLRKVLEMGYNFVFSDTDIMWFRDPFPRFDKSADLQIACDKYTGIPEDLDNQPNGGFVYARSNNRTIDFYKYWYMSREDHPGLHDQDVLNEIKFDQDFVDIGLELRFLNTLYFGGFCEVSKDLEQVCTMHANCCTGLQRKLKDLRLVKEDWKCFRQMSPQMKKLQRVYWRAPRQCLLSFEV